MPVIPTITMSLVWVSISSKVLKSYSPFGGVGRVYKVHRTDDSSWMHSQSEVLRDLDAAELLACAFARCLALFLVCNLLYLLYLPLT